MLIESSASAWRLMSITKTFITRRMRITIEVIVDTVAESSRIMTECD